MTPDRPGPVIELDRPAPAPTPRPTRWWRLAPALAGCLLLGAAAAPAPQATSGPPLPARATLLAAGRLLLVVDPTTLTGYTPTGRTTWRVPAPAGAWSAASVGDLVLVTTRDTARQVTGTSAYTADTGQLRWRRPDRVDVAGAAAVAVTEVRSVADPGQRIQGTVRGVDLATGADRWSTPVPSTAVLATSPGRIVVVHDSGLARVHDVRHGAAIAETRLPPAGYAPDNPVVVGDHLVLRHPGPGGTTLSGYDLPSLTPRWQRLLPVGETPAPGCPRVLCLVGLADRRALDPGTGAQVWRWPGGAGWRPVPGDRDATRQVLLRPGGDGRVSAVDVGSDGPRPGGTLPAGTRDCHLVADALACRGPDGRLTLRSAAGT
ncbi:PQQ-binding-like beta-propeller repeat protein [Micromonospora sp. WMMD980]|uniref:outer membrane protein assembly factor BamB family protein n=1 Tax=Micromonospora sp. WMMD980 TaxID=3016088 RepID=UPI002417D6FF|nr:PQQ-binding-like beta-propeller repeat protein [Micromonospora sp. WMMD980]MDG4800873.1 PQQ-binding-like beta-propeller repeat protein [Micromonospora sp. WMMD980]